MSGRTIEYAVPSEGEGKRVRSVLQGQLGLSAGLVTRLKHRPDSVRINGAPARTIDILHAGDVLAVDVGDAKPGAFSPSGPRPDVVWEDDDILIINKPAGMAVHGRSERGEPTVGSMVSAYLGTNTPIDRCYECGFEGDFEPTEEGFKCPECGNSDPDRCNVTKRTCGYLGNPVQRPMVHGRHEEIAHRVKHMSGETGHVTLDDGSEREWFEEAK